MSFTALLLAVVFSADTSNPTNSFFRRGEAATVTFAVSGIPSGETFKLESAIYDEHDRKLADMPALDVAGGSDGKWTGSLPLPTERYGYYRLRAKCGGTELPKVGTRPPGCITYAVVFDPDKRKRYPDDWTFYGLMGGALDVDRWLGTTFHFASATPLSKAQIAKKKSRGESTALTPGTISAGNHENLAKFMPPEGRAFCASNGIRSVNLWNYLKSPGGWTVRYRMAIPWAFMNRSAAPAAGESARFALWVCDRDAGDKGARHGVKLFDFRRASAPKRYGRVIMGEK